MLTLLQRSCTPPRGGSAFRRGVPVFPPGKISPAVPSHDWDPPPRQGSRRPAALTTRLGLARRHDNGHLLCPLPVAPLPLPIWKPAGSHWEAYTRGRAGRSPPRGPLYPAPRRFSDWTRSRRVCRKRGASLGRARCPGRSDGSGGSGEDGGGGGGGGAAAPVFLP